MHRQARDGSYVFASESCALDAVGAASWCGMCEPGEIVVVDEDGHALHPRPLRQGARSMPACLSISILPGPDSVIDGASVHEARLRAGAFLALEHPVRGGCGHRRAGFAAWTRRWATREQSGIPYGIGFIKNRYIGRTFIAADPADARERRCASSSTPSSRVVEGKRVVLVDDSIVRGTTCARIVQLLRRGGREGGAYAHLRAAVHASLLFRHRYRPARTT